MRRCTQINKIVRCSTPERNSRLAPLNTTISCPLEFISPLDSPTRILQHCTALLQTCGSSYLNLKQIHAFSIRYGVPLSEPRLGKYLIYTAVNLSIPMPYLHRIFSQLKDPNTFTWNAMIRGYAESENPKPAIELFCLMHRNSVEPDTHTFPFALKAVAKAVSIRVGEGIHSIAVRNGFESLVFVQNSLVHMYSMCGQHQSALKVFELMPERDVVTWNSVINGFSLNGEPGEALMLYQKMHSQGVKPDGFTMVSLFSACSKFGALALGRRAHVYMVKVGLNQNLHAINALLDFYAKCGSTKEAENVFDDMTGRNVVSWTSLIVGLAVNGYGNEALKYFKKMEAEGWVPSEITFVGVLYACSHSGMVDDGFRYFERMKQQYGIVPLIEHYGCMVDMLARAGKVKQAFDYIHEMPLQPNSVIWRTLLGACTKYGNVELAEASRVKLLQLEPEHSGDYVLISNLYSSKRRWSDAQEVRKSMLDQGVAKIRGNSLVELGNQVHEFHTGSRTHSESKEIYAMLGEMTKRLRLEGYVPHTSHVYADIEEEEKENSLVYHSEKIAIAFMLINSTPETPIRVFNNLRVCADCHTAIKLITKVYCREIIVRDCSRFHHFRDGSCSCGDYW
ncbi:Pentatricopeptide repeat-containing protein At4g21065 [Linum perenne]